MSGQHANEIAQLHEQAEACQRRADEALTASAREELQREADRCRERAAELQRALQPGLDSQT